MDFTLFYRGQLKSNGGYAHKHDIRKVFHRQMQHIWRKGILKDWIDHELEDSEYERKVGKIIFFPLVSSSLQAYCEIAITWLRPGPAGRLVEGGDIDNRLKTLFDALCIPQLNAIPSEAVLPDGDTKIYCLLEDDKLITRLNIATDQYLEPEAHPNDVLLLLKVHTIPRIVSFGTMSGLSGIE